MKGIPDISAKRWFMGKGRSIKAIREFDSTDIGDTRLLIIEVEFQDSSKDLYTIVEDESRIGNILEEAFADGASSSIFHGKQGYFIFKSRGRTPTKYFRTLKPISTEQSNSAYFNPGKIFFKLFRRLQEGAHPEAEILEQLNEKNFSSTPRLYGSCVYRNENGHCYTLGIIEEHLTGYSNVWEYFNKQMDANAAKVLGIETARMHQALKGLDGVPSKGEDVPFQKLKDLLNASSDGAKKNSEILQALPHIEQAFNQALLAQKKAESNSQIFIPQRIHGDFHLGQILIGEKGGEMNVAPTFKILDFEGEPTRSIEFRRALRSPAVDIAGMLRSFRYAAANSGLNSQTVEEAFIEGYSQESGVAEACLKYAAAPYLLAKAVYEACYELEFRPSWFHIPAQALLDFAP